MADVFTQAKRSAVMARIRSHGNQATELALVRVLRAHRITGWRRHVRVAVERRASRVEGQTRFGARLSSVVPRLAVRPDFVFRKSRTVIFVDGCFWHGCPKHATQPKNNRAFWRRKFSANKARDMLVTRTLRRAGWRVVRVWEHTLQWATMKSQNETRLARRIRRVVGNG
jgi:DNA mismatch endonuclease, patch repair protein